MRRTPHWLSRRAGQRIPYTTAFYLAAPRQVKKIFPGFANPVGEYIEILIQEGKEEIFLK